MDLSLYMNCGRCDPRSLLPYHAIKRVLSRRTRVNGGFETADRTAVCHDFRACVSSTSNDLQSTYSSLRRGGGAEGSRRSFSIYQSRGNRRQAWRRDHSRHRVRKFNVQRRHQREKSNSSRLCAVGTKQATGSHRFLPDASLLTQ